MRHVGGRFATRLGVERFDGGFLVVTCASRERASFFHLRVVCVRAARERLAGFRTLATRGSRAHAEERSLLAAKKVMMMSGRSARCAMTPPRWRLSGLPDPYPWM